MASSSLVIVISIFLISCYQTDLTSGQFSPLDSIANGITSAAKSISGFIQPNYSDEFSDKTYNSLDQKKSDEPASNPLLKFISLDPFESLNLMTDNDERMRAFAAGRPYMTATNSMSQGYASLIQTASCLALQELHDPDLGSFPMDHDLYCNYKCGRSIPGVTCCHPQHPAILAVKFRYFEPNKPERILNFRNPDDVNIIGGRNSTDRIVFIVHGWIEKMNTSPWMIPMVKAFNANGDKVIFVDWRNGNQVHYWQAVGNTRVIGAMIGRAIINWDIAERTLIVGFSLGAQIAGEAGRYTQTNAGLMINECHGLDPAGPFYDGCPTEIQLDKSDCRLVQAIHTSAEDVDVAGVIAARLGTYKKSGHCDYWINCGHQQGPCIDMELGELIRGFTRLMLMSDAEISQFTQERFCSHWRSPAVYVSSLARTCDYPARICTDCGRNGKCSGSKGTPANDTLIPHSKCTPDMDVSYWISSNQFKPHC